MFQSSRDRLLLHIRELTSQSKMWACLTGSWWIRSNPPLIRRNKWCCHRLVILLITGCLRIWTWTVCRKIRSAIEKWRMSLIKSTIRMVPFNEDTLTRQTLMSIVPMPSQRCLILPQPGRSNRHPSSSQKTKNSTNLNNWRSRLSAAVTTLKTSDFP